MELTLCNATTGLDQSIGESRFAMVNMGNNAKVPNMFHKKGSSGIGPGVPFTVGILVNDVSD